MKLPYLWTLLAFLVTDSQASMRQRRWSDKPVERRLLDGIYKSVILPTGEGGCSGTQEAVLDIYRGADSSGSPTVVHLVGGAYMNLVDITLDGSAGESYLDAGYTVAVLWYRLPRSSTSQWWLVCSDDPHEALDDVVAAMAHLRENAVEYHVDTNSIVTSGFSAGGHLAALHGTTCIGSDCPAAMVLHFPWLETGAKIFCTAQGQPFSSNNDFDACFPTALVGASAPPVVLYHAEDDTLTLLSWITAFAQSLVDNGVPFEWYEVLSGGHQLVPFSEVVAVSNGVLTGNSGYAELITRALGLVSPACDVCDDVPTSWMTNNGLTCETGTWHISTKCYEETYWVNNGFCRKSCHDAGRGYAGDNCC